MAKHRRRRHHLGNYVSVPMLGNIKEYSPFGHSVNSTDVMVGAGIALLGGAGVAYGINQLNTMTGGKIPSFVTDNIAPIAEFGAGALAYMVQRKGHRSRATGHLVGASLVAAVDVVWPILKSTSSFFAPLGDYVSVPYGLLTSDRMSGMGLLTADSGVSAYDDDSQIFAAP